MRKAVCWILAVVSASLSPAAEAKVAPEIIGDRINAQCRQTLEMASAAFRSTNPSLIWPIATPLPVGVTIVLAPNGEDISGGDALDADASTFSRIDRLPSTSGVRAIFLQKVAVNGQKLAVVDKLGSWRGDTYELYLLPAGKSLDGFITVQSSAGQGTPVLGSDRWNPPLILKDMKSNVPWIIDRGEPYEVLADWKVYTLRGAGLTSPCRITFGLPTPQGLALLPAAVRRLAALADEVLGPGTGEGTLRQTDRIRQTVEKEWAIAAVRPWALTTRPYNSRQQVDNGLVEWVGYSTLRRRVYRSLQRDYAASEQALASYYVVNFKLDRQTARTFSGYAMDHMLRSYFVFHNEDAINRPATITPWPLKVR